VVFQLVIADFSVLLRLPYWFQKAASALSHAAKSEAFTAVTIGSTKPDNEVIPVEP
jgi:hypothetical protein